MVSSTLIRRRGPCALALLSALCTHTKTCVSKAHASFAPPKSSSFWTGCAIQQTPAKANAIETKLQSQKAATSALPFVSENELPPDFPRRNDAMVAISAVRRASLVARSLQPPSPPPQQDDASTTTEEEGTGGTPGGTISSLAANGIRTVTKSDLSPVTVADYAVQAMVLQDLHGQFPSDTFIAEESSVAPLADRDLMDSIQSATGMKDANEVARSLDFGQTYQSDGKLKSSQGSEGGRCGIRRTWCLDPIDGTKGFLRGKREGGQYCVALALLEDGVPTLGVLGCPNLPAHADDDNYEWKHGEEEGDVSQSRGCIFVASQGGGCYQLPLLHNEGDESSKNYERLHVTANDGSAMGIQDARLCIGVEKYSDPLGQCNGVAEILHGRGAIDADGGIVKAVRMDSQAKYGVLARGGAEVLLRLPRQGYVEWIWDLAAGAVVIQEAGGKISDVYGNLLDFSQGAKLPASVRGVVATNGGMFHQAVLDAYREQRLIREMHSMCER